MLQTLIGKVFNTFYIQFLMLFLRYLFVYDRAVNNDITVESTTMLSLITPLILYTYYQVVHNCL